jgi:protein tyrosine phosphatase (PTP) superfamily phosphohydrolase (DUF442 family)
MATKPSRLLAMCASFAAHGATLLVHWRIRRSPLAILVGIHRCRRTHSVIAGVVGGILLAGTVQSWYVLGGGNFHTVIPDFAYRSAQPSAAELERRIQTCRIRTVINLRGPNENKEWYQAERAVSDRYGVAMIDVSLWGCHPPLPEELGRLVEALDQAEGPLLVHCHSGSDRAGLASALLLLLHSGTDLDEARAQLALRFGHNPWGMARCHHRLLDNYGTWLKLQDLPHRAEHLRRWVREGYNRSACIVSETTK